MINPIGIEILHVTLDSLVAGKEYGPPKRFQSKVRRKAGVEAANSSSTSSLPVRISNNVPEPTTRQLLADLDGNERRGDDTDDAATGKCSDGNIVQGILMMVVGATIARSSSANLSASLVIGRKSNGLDAPDRYQWSSDASVQAFDRCDWCRMKYRSGRQSSGRSGGTAGAGRGGTEGNASRGTLGHVRTDEMCSIQGTADPLAGCDALDAQRCGSAGHPALLLIELSSALTPNSERIEGISCDE